MYRRNMVSVRKHRWALAAAEEEEVVVAATDPAAAAREMAPVVHSH